MPAEEIPLVLVHPTRAAERRWFGWFARMLAAVHGASQERHATKLVIIEIGSLQPFVGIGAPIVKEDLPAN